MLLGMDRWTEAEQALRVRTAREREIQINGLNQAYAIFLKQNPTLLGTELCAEFAKAIDDRIAKIRGGSSEPEPRPEPSQPERLPARSA